MKWEIEDEELKKIINSRCTKNINKLQKEKLTIGEKLSDKLANFMGSWKFIFVFVFMLLTWITINLIPMLTIDVYPFSFLNLTLGIVSALTAPIIMMSQNRQEKKSKVIEEQNYRIDLKQEILIELMFNKINNLEESQKIIVNYIKEREKENPKIISDLLNYNKKEI